MAYATKTTVSVEKSRIEIEDVLERYGADQFSYARDDTTSRVAIQFRANGRLIRFTLTLPNRGERRFTHSSRGARSRDGAEREWQQACRSKWRGLLLCIKAKLEAVESGISEFEDEFLAHIILPNSQTASEWLRPKIEAAYESGSMPQILALPAPE